MFDITFDVVLSIILAVSAIALLTGHGHWILTSFRSKSEKDQPLPYDEKKMSITMGILCVIMFLSEMVIIFLSETSQIAVIIAIAAVVISFVVGLLYLKKYAKVEPPKKDSINKRVKDFQNKNKL